MFGRFLSRLPVRPRTAIALGLLLLVALVVGFGKLIGGRDGPAASPDGTTPLSSVDPSTGNDSVVDLVPTPTLGDARTAEVLAVANNFAALWIDHDRPAKAWRDSLTPLCTKTLTGELSGVEPESVPADRITGAASLEVHADATVDVIIPIDAGKLRLRMVAQQNGKWLVDGIDWERV
jgi:hypothetical protein